MHHRRTLSNTSSDSTGYPVFENSSISISSGSPPDYYNPDNQQLLSVQQSLKQPIQILLSTNYTIWYSMINSNI
ncbi:unnamed protein product [Absidia cylindrospora]